MPNLFALQGPGNCGKSSTLIHLHQAIKAKYPAATDKFFSAGTHDIAVLVSGVNGLVIGIESQGDPNSRLQQSLSTFAAANCDIIFCACRTRGMTVQWVNAMSPAYNIHFVAKNPVATNHATANAASAASLMQQAGI